MTSGSPNSTGWASSTRICSTTPARGGGDRVHRLHRLDDQQGLAGGDAVADADERIVARLGLQIDGADHRRLDRLADGIGRRLGRGRRGGGRRRGAAPLRARRRRSRGRPRRSAARATRMRRPSCSTSISVRPVSAEDVGQLAHQTRIDRGGAFGVGHIGNNLAATPKRRRGRGGRQAASRASS